MRPAAIGLLVALLPGAALAVGPAKVGPPQTGIQPTQSELIDRLVADLDHPEEPRRVFAARELRVRVKHAVRLSQSSRGDPLAPIEAVQELQIYDEVLAPRCIAGLGDDVIALPCVDVLGWLETEAAAEPLQALLDGGATGRMRRRVVRALERIRGAGEAP